MIALSGYQFGELIHESSSSIVYRARRRADNQPVILKILQEAYPSPEKIAAFKNEYQIMTSLDLRGVIKAYALEKSQQRWVMVLEDFGGLSLARLGVAGELSPPNFLVLAIRLASIIGQIHQHQVIHKDINPANILVAPFDPLTDDLSGKVQWPVKIIDFGISTRLSRENPTFQEFNVLRGTLAYISPEQTGRMNRALDYRTDFYSLGVTFYELLTGQLPFQSDDPLELVHSHIARRPLAPHELNVDVPPILSDIVLKLLAKNAEDRYQSAHSLRSDLEECLRQQQGLGRIEPFPIAQRDTSDRLQIPQKLYGRQEQLEILLSCFEQVSRGATALVLISGYIGMGKSSLAQELYKSVTYRRGYFISGKFDQFQSDIPYASLIQAFRNLGQQLLMGSEAQIALWREKLLAAFGPNGRIITDVIPEIATIIGPQPKAPALDGIEAQNRFKFLIQKFITVFTHSEQPLVIFLDNLQWADETSLQLIELLMSSPENGYLLLIGTYRDDESQPQSLFSMVERIRAKRILVENIPLPPLNLAQVTQLTTDTFQCSPEQARPLAGLVLEKTGGAPLFIEEFLKSLHTKELINFDHWQGIWQWDLEQIRTQEITDNVVRLMADKAQKLPPETQEVLKLAACIGHQFDLETLALVAQKPAQDVTADLWAAVSEGLVLLLRRTYQFTELDDEGEVIAEYKFAHDQVHQAIYSIIPKHVKQTAHWRIGQLLLRHTLPRQRAERVFDLVNQLNLGRAICIEQSEWDELAELNLLAGQKAKAATAYQSALNYLKVGLELINQTQSSLIQATGATSSWERQYDMTLALYQEALEAAYLCSDFEQMEEYAAAILEQAQSLLHKLKVYEVKMLAYIAQNKLAEVAQTALPILTLLAVRFPREPGQADVDLALQEIETALAGRPAEALLELPTMTDPHRLAAMRILSIFSSTTYFNEPNLLPLIVFKQVTLSIKHGNAPESALAYANYALILCGYIGDIETGYQFGQLALKLAAKLNIQKLAAKTLFTVNAFVYHWKEPLHDCLESLLEAYRQAIETGDLEYAARSTFVYNVYAYFGGKTLNDLLLEMNSHTEMINQLKQSHVTQVTELYEQAIQSLTGQFDDVDYLSKEVVEPEKVGSIQVAEQDKSLIFHLYLNKSILSYLWQDYAAAIEYATIAKTHATSVAAMFVIPICTFYDGLAHLALLREKQHEEATSPQDRTDQSDMLKHVVDCRRKLKRWADAAPMNHRHRYCLVEAEYARILGQDGAAREYYDEAIALAQDNQFINEAALASESAADFYLSKERPEIAQVYLQKANYGYRQWGALRKADDLEARYPQLVSAGRPNRVDPKTTSPTTSGTYTASRAIGALDLTSVIKASQIISGEIMLDALLSKMMTIVIENAGAQKGYLILEKNRVWSIEASGAASQDDIVVLQAIPLSIAAEGRRPILPGSVVNYVIRSYQTIVLNDAANERQFVHDPYIVNSQPKSIMCTPLLTQGKLIGVLYLENNLTTEAFTPDRLEVLNLLSAQAAISIENARFYAHQIELTKAYSRFVPREILHFLNKQSIIDVQLGDQIQQDMTVLFSDIRSFTHLSEQMTPQENFNFINAYLRRVSPIIRKYNGFIDKYMGDAIMALFPSQPNDAMQAAIAMQETVVQYNIERENSGYPPISIGIGLHTGRVMLGTIGEEERMEGTVISDAVNLAARLEGLSKIYGAPIIISGDMMFNLDNPANYKFRFLDKVKVKGKEEAVSIFEILDGQPEKVAALKLQTQDNFERGLLHYHSQEFAEAGQRFQAALAINPNDMAIQLYLRRVEHFITYGVPVDWAGIEALTEK